MGGYFLDVHDEDHDDGLGGRSRDRREFTEQNQRWCHRLLAMDELSLVHPTIPQVVRDELIVARNATSHRARKRSVRRVDMLVSLMADEEIAALEAFLDAPPIALHPEVAGWIRRLREEPDAVIALQEAFPDAEVQRFRTLARNLAKPSLEARSRATLEQLLGELIVLRGE